jgi:hypothetical protein
LLIFIIFLNKFSLVVIGFSISRLNLPQSFLVIFSAIFAGVAIIIRSNLDVIIFLQSFKKIIFLERFFGFLISIIYLIIVLNFLIFNKLLSLFFPILP